eukprot:scaffold5610_cov137-Isochrysis_galbana.AAC.3
MASHIHVMFTVEILATWSNTQSRRIAASALHSGASAFEAFRRVVQLSPRVSLNSQTVCNPRMLPFERYVLIGVRVVSLTLKMPLVPWVGSVGGHI